MSRPAHFSILITSLFAVQIAFAGLGPVQGPEAPETAPKYELDKAGKRSHLDFQVPLKAVSEPLLKFSAFAGHKVVLFYFSAKCPHCQHAAPFVQKLADEMTAKGYQTVGIAIQMNTEDDLRGFIREFNIRIPVFHDSERLFGQNYGTGSIPMLVFINEKGEYIRYKSFDAATTPEWIKHEADLIAKK